jgi:uncharacterized protein (DUF4415 family)
MKGACMNMVSYERGKVPSPPHRSEAEIRALTENGIDTSDIPPITEEQWAQRKPNPYCKPSKTSTTLDIDADVLAWFQLKGNEYINTVLREVMLKESRN